MAFVENFLIPLIKVIVWIAFFGFLTIVIIRAIWIKWSRSWRYILKYDLFRGKVDPVKAQWCMEAIQKGWNRNKIKMMLTLKGFGNEDIYDLLFICGKFSKKFNIKNVKEKKYERKDMPTI